MAQGDIHVGDVGVAFQVQFLQSDGSVLNISAATVKTITFDRPRGDSQLVVSGTLLTDGTDGIAQYVTLAGDLSVAGVWAVQGYVEIPGYKGHTATGSFTVKSNL